MKFVKILSLILALLMIGGAMVACGGGTETDAQTESDTEAEGGDDTSKDIETTDEPLTVNIVVKKTQDGEVVYRSEPNGYKYEGEILTVQEIFVEFMSSEYDIEPEFNDEGELVKVGDLVKADNTYFWLFSIAKHPQGEAQAEPVDGNIDEYDDIEENDTIVIYLNK